MAKGDPKVQATPDSGESVKAPRRARRPSLSRDALLAKVLDLFEANGFDGTSIDAITVEAGVSKRTLYERFGDKETLFRSAMEHAIANWVVPVERLHALEEHDLESSLGAIAKVLLDNVLSPQGLRLMRMANAISRRMPEIGAYLLKVGTEPMFVCLKEIFGRRLELDEASATYAADAYLNIVVRGPALTAAWGAVLDRDRIVRDQERSVALLLAGLTMPAMAAPGQSRSSGAEHAEARLALETIKSGLVSIAASLAPIESALPDKG